MLMTDQGSSYHPIFLDLLRTLQKAEDRESAIHAVMDTIASIYHPEQICYIPEDLREGKVMGNCDQWHTEARLLPDQVIKLLPSKKGFVLSLKSKGKRIGVLMADGVRNPNDLNSSLSLLFTIPDALDMALSNIQYMKELNESRTQLTNLSQSLSVANKILRHDIANELLIISSSLDLYVVGGKSRDLERAQTSLQHMQVIITQMRELDHFLLSNNELTPVSLKEVVETVLPSMEMLYVMDGDAKVLADPALRAVIENLVSNAKKHGQASGMEFKIARHNGRTVLSVWDDGKGIPSEYVDRIFMEGVSFGSKRGTGLGLYLVKRTMERYEGNISLINDPRGGTRFDLTFRSAEH
ncbi:MAG: HAMP domain-containing histidine kinase [Methanomassiliicoccales archaeon]|nr:HAMP domain-containing histidine kinase [Methanomassiliicoccales archaeon]